MRRCRRNRRRCCSRSDTRAVPRAPPAMREDRSPRNARCEPQIAGHSRCHGPHDDADIHDAGAVGETAPELAGMHLRQYIQRGRHTRTVQRLRPWSANALVMPHGLPLIHSVSAFSPASARAPAHSGQAPRNARAQPETGPPPRRRSQPSLDRVARQHNDREDRQLQQERAGRAPRPARPQAVQTRLGPEGPPLGGEHRFDDETQRDQDGTLAGPDRRVPEAQEPPSCMPRPKTKPPTTTPRPSGDT